MTGPIGGGDGKVDSDNYSVDPSLAITWLVTSPEKAATEKWAFAISAKEKWKPKVKSDVQSIVGTDRDYKKIFFVSNQFISGRKRQELQDEVQELHGVQLKILDRNWIVDKVFSNGHQELAVKTLQIDNIEVLQKKKVGSLDTVRQDQLDVLEKQIADQKSYKWLQYQLAEDCLSAALLARSLGQSLDQVEVKFARAERVAKTVNINSQLLRIVYNKAWTLFFWYDEVDILWELYLQAERYTVDSERADDFELLTNLWTLLHPKMKRGDCDNISADFNECTKRLLKNLDQLIEDDSRPTNSLKARYSKNHIRFIEDEQGNITVEILAEFSAIANMSETLLGFPTQQFVERIKFLGNVFHDNEAYDSLLLECLEILEKRTGEATTGLGLMNRAFQLLENRRYLSAVMWFGKAVSRLAKYEYSHSLVGSMIGSSHAYSELGLEWAARTQLVAAASLLIKEITKTGRSNKITHHVLRRLIWTEIKLGRIPCIVDLTKLLNTVTCLVEEKDVDMDDFIDERKMLDGVLGILIVQSSLSDLKSIPTLPDYLGEIGFPYSRISMLYAMGHEDVLISEGMFEEGTTSEEMKKFFLKFFDQPAYKELLVSPNYLTGRRVKLQTKALGCEVIFECDSIQSSISVSETICSSLQSLLATSTQYKISPHVSKVPVDVIQDLDKGDSTSIEFVNNRITVHHPPESLSGSTDNLERTQKWIVEFISHFIGHFFIVDSPEEIMKEIMADEEGMQRSLNFTKIDILMSNLVDRAKHYSFGYLKQGQYHEYSTIRTEKWYNSIKPNVFDLKPGSGDIPEELNDYERLSHHSMKAFSLINMSLWNDAGWRGTGYEYAIEVSELPRLILTFEKGEIGIKIFKEWVDEMGYVDKKERLMVTIIKGINRDTPDDYRVMIGENIGFSSREQGNLLRFSTTFRILEMKSTSKIHFDTFWEIYQKQGKYKLMPGQIEKDGSIQLPADSIQTSSGEQRMPSLIKKELKMVDAWQIGRHNIEGAVINADDDVYIPEGVSDAPILELLKWKKSKSSSELK